MTTQSMKPMCHKAIWKKEIELVKRPLILIKMLLVTVVSLVALAIWIGILVPYFVVKTICTGVEFLMYLGALGVFYMLSLLRNLFAENTNLSTQILDKIIGGNEKKKNTERPVSESASAAVYNEDFKVFNDGLEPLTNTPVFLWESEPYEYLVEIGAAGLTFFKAMRLELKVLELAENLIGWMKEGVPLYEHFIGIDVLKAKAIQPGLMEIADKKNAGYVEYELLLEDGRLHVYFIDLGAHNAQYFSMVFNDYCTHAEFLKEVHYYA